MLSNSTAKVSAMMLCALVPALADIKIAAKYVAEGQTTETVTYVHGERLRYNYGKGESLLRQCDLKRIVQVDDNAKTFLSQPAEQPVAEPAQPAPQIDVVDTGERKDMFGFSARHLKMTETTAGAKTRTETDGWYIDLKDMPTCSATAVGSKTDTAPTGFPASYVITTFGEAGKPPSIFTMEITDLAVAPLEPALFDIPTGYKEAGKTAEVTALPKTPGTIRLGTIPLRNRSAQKNVPPAPYSHLLSQLQTAHIDVMPLIDEPETAVKSKATQAQCDYILYTELMSVEKPPVGKLGGILHKTPIVGKATDGDEYEARVDYRLIPLVEGVAPLESSAVVKTGHSFNWVGAAMLASNFIPMTAAARMFGGAGALNPAMLNMLVKGGAAGNPMMGMDPMMSGMSMFLRSANMMGGAAAAAPNVPNPAGMDAAIAAALDQQSKALVAHLKK